MKLRRFATMRIKYEINRQILDIFENLVNLKLVAPLPTDSFPKAGFKEARNKFDIRIALSHRI